MSSQGGLARFGTSLIVPPWRISPDTTSGTPGERAGVVILGGTGSVGTSALSVMRESRERFTLVAVSSTGRDHEKLSRIAREFQPPYFVISDPSQRGPLSAALAECPEPRPSVLVGDEGISEVVALPSVRAVVGAVSGSIGLFGVHAALCAGKRVALANKESVSIGADLLLDACLRFGGEIVPVDSEHSSLFQLLVGEVADDVAHLTITASGGPFLRTPSRELPYVTPEMAVRHPRWSMGPKISVDSATMVNKGLEIIEAAALFGIPERYVDVLIHPESIVHGLVTMKDGGVKAHLSTSEMAGAVAFALAYPSIRCSRVLTALDLPSVGALHFESLNTEQFPAVSLARAASNQGIGATLVFSTANEVAVEAFLVGSLPFTGIVPFIEKALSSEIPAIRSDSSVAHRIEVEREIRRNLAVLR